MSKAIELLHASKQVLNSGLLVEVKIWKVEKSLKYIEGIRYRLVLVDPLQKCVLILFDNHYPKGPHLHNRDGIETEYQFESMQKLIEDFFKAIVEIEREYENNENKNRE